MKNHIIPNRLIVGLVLAFYAYAVASAMPFAQIGQHTLTAVVALLAGFAVCVLTGRMLGGTMKLVAVAFLWFGLVDGMTFLMFSMFLSAGAAKLSQMRGGPPQVPYLPFAAVTACAMVLLPVLT